jgi:uncharacterized membrane protein YccC
VAARVQTKDPEHDALRRAARAAIVLPVAAAVGMLVGGGAQTPLFAIVGSVALLILVDFPGNRPARALAYAGLAVNGAVLIVVGTLAAHSPWLSVALMFVLGAAVTLSGVISEIVAAGRRATLLTYVLPACTQVGPIPDRLLGWFIALAVCVPASLFVLPPRHHDELRRHAAEGCRTLADRLDGAATADEVAAAMHALRANFLGADFRPVGLTAGSRALVRVVDDLEWLSDRVDDDTADLLSVMKEPAVRVLRDSARLLSIARPAERAATRADLESSLAVLRVVAQGLYREDITTILDEPDDMTAVAVGRQLLTRRTMAASIALTGRVIRLAAAADARPVWARVLGRGLPSTGAADLVLPEAAAIASITSGFLASESVALRNSLRTGLGLAIAVAVTHVFAVQHGFWVVLGALSVLRSSAVATGSNVVRAVVGTGVGFVLGAVIIQIVGVNPIVMWLLLPVMAFGAAYVPQVASYAAGQAAFTMLVLINFNLIVPLGWQVGLLRVQDVAIGALVGALVSVLLWPRGATAVVRAAIDDASLVVSNYLKASVLRVTRGASEAANDKVITLGHDALVAQRTVDDAVRQYLSESGGPTDFRAPVVRAANRVIRGRGAADRITDVVPPPLDCYPQARKVLEEHTQVVCDRLVGFNTGRPVAPVSDDLVVALRTETSGGDLAVSAALPLVTVAANLGELELVYRKRAAPVAFIP